MIHARYVNQKENFCGSDLHPNYHKHMYEEMLLVCSGDVLALSSEAYLAHCGPCVLFYRSRHIHAQINHPDTGYERFYLTFESSDPVSLFPEWNLQPPFAGSEIFLLPITEQELKQLRKAAELLCTLDASYQEDAVSERQKMKFLLGYFLAEVSEIGKNQPCIQPKYVYLTAIAAYISKHLSEKLTIDGLSKHFDVGRTKLIYDFKACFSMTIQNFIVMERIDRAKALLQQGKSVADTAEACGFSDSAHFIRVFKSTNDMTPAVYRKIFMENADSGIPLF